MEADDKFIQFGCWNNLNTKVKDGQEKQLGCLNKVLGLLNDYLSKVEVKPKFLIISGDNYYPEKQKVDDVTTNIVIYPDKLIEGFKKIEIDLPIYMMLGNHDLEKTPKEEEPTKQECKILELEMANKPANVEYIFFKYVMLKNGTMILMIDTSIYEDDSEEYLQCYNKFFESSGQSFSSVEEIREYQLEQIMDAIEGKELRNIIIVGHHPIIYFKYKKGKDGKKAKIHFRSDIRNLFQPVLAHIYGKLGPATNYYYLCSDMHLYQKGKIELQMGAETMRIQQYIVGTGGTELDSPLPPDYDEKVKTEDIITYALEDEKAQCGFLECVVKEEGLEFTPIFVPSKGGNKKTKNKRSKRSKRTKKRSKQNKKTK